MSKTPPPFLPGGISNPLIPRKPWEVYETEPLKAAVELGQCVALIPRNVNEWTDLIHWHELGHVWAFDGQSIFGATEPGIFDNILVEPQVNTLLLRMKTTLPDGTILRGVDVSKAMRVFDWTDHPIPLLPRDCGVMWINIAFYLRDTDNLSLLQFAARLEEKIREGHDGHNAFQACYNAVQAVIKKPDRLTRQTWAVKLAEYFAPPPPAPALTPELDSETRDAIDKAEAEEEAKKEEDRARDHEEIAKSIAAGASIDNMEIHRHLTRARPGRRITSPGSHRTTGIIPEAFDRYCTDRAIFRIRKPTGSLVIDCSGSMHWDWEALKRGLHTFPNVIVACYTGFHDDRHGRLCVIAEKGRWSEYNPKEELARLGYGNNTVDYPALLWLATQPRPRVWLSDGQFCGGNRANNADNITDIMRKAKIVRIADLEGALAYFMGRAVPVFPICSDYARRDEAVLRKKR